MIEILSLYWVQLVAALAGGLLVYAAAYVLPQGAILGFLILMIPFQVIDSRYGSANMIFTYLVLAAWFFRRQIRSVPLVVPTLLILWVYLISLSQALPNTYQANAIYLLSFASNIAIAILVYNYVSDERRLRFVLGALVGMNILVIGYCTLQIALGGVTTRVLGVDELAIGGHAVRGEGDVRLSGPFNTYDLLGEYLVFQILIVGYLLMRQFGQGMRPVLWLVLMGNLSLVIMTANRTALVTLFIGSAFLGLVYARSRGWGRFAARAAVASVGFVVIASAVGTFTEFSDPLERLATTEFEEGLPNGRKGWPEFVGPIMERPVVGHGPMIIRTVQGAGGELPGMPHSLYLYLLYTVGVSGLLGFLFYYLALARVLLRARAVQEPALSAGVAEIGIIVLIAFLTAQIMMEHLRWIDRDFQHYTFLLWSVFVSAARLTTERVPDRAVARTEQGRQPLAGQGSAASLIGTARDPR